jgi:glutamate-1-semialdehyde 2,1-aminomutase
MAAAHATLAELARDGGALLARANRMGETLMEGIGSLARKHKLALTVTGFGAAFAAHFTTKAELRDYRAILSDDREMLRRFLFRALEQGLHIVPDGRFYVSAAHTTQDIEETLAALDRAFSGLDSAG